MMRDLSAGMQTAVAAGTGEFCWLFDFDFSGGMTRLTTAAADIVWSGNTYSAFGGLLRFEAIQETGDVGSQSVRVWIDGVDQSIISILLSEDYIGRLTTIYLAHLGTDGAVIADPVVVFTGYMNHTWEVEDVRPEDGTPGYCTINTMLSSPLVKFKQVRGIRTNVNSHQSAGREHPYSADTFFRHIPQVKQLNSIEWGKVRG